MANEITVRDVERARSEVSEVQSEVYRLFSLSPDDSEIEKLLDEADDELVSAASKLGYVLDLLQQQGTLDRGTLDRNVRIELLCHAIAFQRLVKLGYGGTVRTIEPHVLREVRSGRTLLYALKLQEGQAPAMRSYLVDRIESVEVTLVPFVGPERD